jgi:hypothetical protein
MVPFKSPFETEGHFRARMTHPTKAMFEAEEHFQRRLANNGMPQGLFESEGYYRRRTQGWATYQSARIIAEHDGRVAARCSEYPDFVGYGADEHAAKAALLVAIDERGAW